MNQSSNWSPKIAGSLFAFVLICSLFAVPPISHSDVIHLKNGKKVSVERTWQEGNRIRYEKNGNIFGFSKELVAQVESGIYVPDPREASLPGTSSDKSIPIEVRGETLEIAEGLESSKSEIIKESKIDHHLLQSIENEARLQPKDSEKKVRYLNALRDAILWHVNHNELASALSLTEPYLRLDPDNLQANLLLAGLHLKQGQYRQAENVLLRAQIKHHESPDLLYLLGMSYYLQDKNEAAARLLQQSLELRYRPEVEQLAQKIDQENRTENNYQQANSLHFVVRYEGNASNHLLGHGILASLERSFSELETQLDFSPRESIAVVLYPNEAFQDVTKTPSWVGALNDGKIRFPIKGLSFVDEQVRRILKHELTHSFLRLKTAGNCPLWLNEGLAQHLSGESSRLFLPLAKQAISQKRFPLLSDLQEPFLSMSATQASWAYQQSLLATDFLVKSYGLSDVQRLLEGIGQAGSFQTGLKIILGKDYAELQREFEDYVKGQ